MAIGIVIALAAGIVAATSYTDLGIQPLSCSSFVVKVVDFDYLWCFEPVKELY